MTKILLIDTYERVQQVVASSTGLPVEWASFGNSRKCARSNLDLFRDPREFPVIIDDALNVLENWQQETRDREAARGSKEPPLEVGNIAGISSGEPLSRYSFAWTVRDTFEEALRGGNVIVIFAGPQHRVSLPPWRDGGFSDHRIEVLRQSFNSNHWPEDISKYASLPAAGDPVEYNSFAGLASARFAGQLTKFGQHFEKYAERFADHMSWHAAWDTLNWGGSQKEGLHPLFFNSSGRCIGFVQECYLNKKLLPDREPGLAIVLPNVEGVHERTEAILFLLSEVLPYLKPKFFPGHWFATYWPSTIEDRRYRIAEQRRRLETELAKAEAEVDLMCQGLTEFKHVISLKGEQLKLLVAKILGDALACKVTDLDAKLKKGEPKGPDLLLERNGLNALVEVKGSRSANLRQEDIAQFQTHIENYVTKRGPVTGRLLVFNGQASLAPSDRETFHRERVQQAISAGITLLSGVQLLELAARRKDNTVQETELLRLLSIPGDVASGWDAHETR